ncbi:hypothetical protein B0H16DRAFT_273697 [Mycena metata]|uniref:Uncharacterized protein n=1 Tax=Mycena metata TaxID=1033252 RepID=A0AAD7NNF6_9AGAR|nr:hypothetical protein B0H16DRAFT_273697 [Mycena metata]
MSGRISTISRSSVASLALLLQTAPSPARLVVLLQTALRAVPTAAKYFGLLLLLLNVRSLPLVWHIRVWSSVVQLRLALRWHRITHAFLPAARRKAALQAWYEDHLPVGSHPFRSSWTWSSWVSVDDGDFNLHMSNSSYPKALDSARFRLALEIFPNIFRCGGWVPLSATYFHFIREIPMLTRYDVRTSIGAWDEKWIWFISRFVKPPSKKSSSKRSNKNAIDNSQEQLIPSLKTPATPLTDGGITPLINGVNGVNGTSAEPDAVSRALLARAKQEMEPDGAVLYTVAVSQLCYKHGRITVPPAVILAANGFYSGPAPSPSSTSTSTSTSTSANRSPNQGKPPHWPTVAALNAADAMPALAKFYAGGWRDAPAGERWWEDAFAASEEERKVRMGVFVGEEYAANREGGARKGGLSGGLEGVRGLKV